MKFLNAEDKRWMLSKNLDAVAFDSSISKREGQSFDLTADRSQLFKRG